VPDQTTIKHPLCRLDELVDGLSRGFDPLDEGRDTMFVVRRGEKLFAWRNACPHHDYARMAWKKHEFLNGDKTAITCAAHGALFDIETGMCNSGPPLGQKLARVDVEIRDGSVWITGPYAPGLRKRKLNPR
jgi:nitrite reductase/ring-hydroxylating ferredoxin subunit